MERTGLARSGAEETQRMDVALVAGDSYEITVRGHRLRVDQPTDSGGADLAPTPTELFVASLASCVAFYAGRYLTRHGVSRDGLGVAVEYEMATDRPARVAAVRLAVQAPAGLPPQRRHALNAVVSRCTVHNTLVQPPSVTIEVVCGDGGS
ncbi:OsmC family protein [Asanoa sp. NPDC049518]|uniref:OsmC family protein n=1 Tax=unclassified Asanoa TaxID=2685164 RepID=UPI00341B9C4D